MKQIFTRILGVDVTYTTRVEDFIKHSGPKITYTRQPLQNEFFIRNNDLLFQSGINDFSLTIESWEGVPCFFRTGERSNLPFDIFAAGFFLLSRYEEYQPHVKDQHGRFPPTESAAYRHNFLRIPIVDVWAYKMLEKLKERFPDIETKNRMYGYTSIIDVTTSHEYAHRGLLRTVAGIALDTGRFRFRRISERLAVLLGIKQDPFNNFGKLIELHQKTGVNSMFFFQFADYSTYDKNVSTENNKFRYLIKWVADYSTVSLAASYSSFHDNDLLKNEKNRLSEVIHRPVNYSRMRYNRVDVPGTYQNLVEAEFTDDFTMGYTHEIGFRAGTCTPFYFYDIAMEEQQPIKVHPFAIHDYALLDLKSEEVMLREIDAVYDAVKKVNGQLKTVFSNELLGSRQKVNWLELYSKLIGKYHV
ncbi:polysaccharide deacetylase family protein [Lentiprolixibacter aurantiacus]|uniref:Polysaccharide deacetylase family protein n=1 Tax=Lentiprolixibacter aurantiacus TaxID=2993939 RepID=A0AAE3SPD1_9FLAO|nr:polysaccharide deacetylase family protein [Lentiprolixibacter aurantiacus]MCX2720702.1 polysaccharide deacetylase family protein [Lentiprolixibacter aurantiacus]